MISERLLQIIEYKKISNTAFAKEIGVTPQGFGNYLNGRDPSYATVVKIIETFSEINPDWLLTGKGEMLRSKEPESSEKYIASLEKNVHLLEENISLKDAEINRLKKALASAVPQTANVG